MPAILLYYLPLIRVMQTQQPLSGLKKTLYFASLFDFLSREKKEPQIPALRTKRTNFHK